jgi:hypothetical protein
MSIKDDATKPEISRLLALFPLAQLRETWPKIKADTKDALCDELAESQSRDTIVTFVDESFGLCRQHVYLFGRDKPADVPKTVPDGDRVRHAKAETALYLVRAETQVMLADPPQETSIIFLWPIRLDVTAKFAVVRFIVLEKDIPSYFQRKSFTGSTSVDEQQIINSISGEMALTKLDIHKGVKHLCKTKYMDCHSTRYRKSKSSAAEFVDKTEPKGIRENDPELFKVLMKSPMMQSVFHIDPAENAGVEKFAADPSAGKLSFLQYTKVPGAIEGVVRKILKNN